MRLLNVKNIELDPTKLKEIDELRNYTYRQIISKKENQITYLERFLHKYNNLQNIMLTKSAQQEATSEKEIKVYTEDLHKSMNYIVNRLKDKSDEISNVDILNLHRYANPIAHKKHPNNYRFEDVLVGSHAPPAYEKVTSLMSSLLWNLNEPGIHPIIMAAYAHHEFVRIHPFVDGNGRVGRLLGNWILMNNLYAPTYIKSNEKELYNKTLGKSFEEIEKNINRPGKNTINFFNSVLDREKRSLDQIIEDN